MATTKIDKQDVLNVAKDLKKELTIDQITLILEAYDDYEDESNDNWAEIVETIIYDVLNL